MFMHYCPKTNFTGTCPNCGYCPACGRSDRPYRTYPWAQPYIVPYVKPTIRPGWYPDSTSVPRVGQSYNPTTGWEIGVSSLA